MADAFLGEIRLVSYPNGKVPVDWMPCDGRLLSVNAPYTALFSLLGTTYGGDGKVNFGLPDLRGRVPVNASQELARGAKGGVETVALTPPETPAHYHLLNAYAGTGNQVATPNAVYAETPLTVPIYGNPANLVALSTKTPELDAIGGGQAHENRQPFIALNYIICWQGIYPPKP